VPASSDLIQIAGVPAQRRGLGFRLGSHTHTHPNAPPPHTHTHQQGALRLSKASARAAGVGHKVKLHHGNCSSWAPPCTPTFVATNPPWGGRLLAPPGGAERDSGGASQQQQQQQQRGRRQGEEGAANGERPAGLEGAWAGLAAFLKGRCPGAKAWVLSGAPELTRGLGMRSFKKRSVSVGGVKVALLGYDVLPPREGGARWGRGEDEEG
jgi:23S rRNA G2445 N2-methylase RlmL